MLATALISVSCWAVGTPSVSAASPRVASPSGLAAVGGTPLLAGARLEGLLPPSTAMRLSIALEPRDPVGLAQLAAAVSTPSSPSYGSYISPSVFAARYGATSSVLEAVTGYLHSAGLSTGSISANGLSVSVSGPASSVSRAFHTTIARFGMGARAVFANTSSPSLPSAISPSVAAVFGLDDLATPVRHSVAIGSSAAVAPHACSAAVKAGPPNTSYTADQIAAAYHFSSAYAAGDDGQGVTIGVYELEQDLGSDVNAYQACFGLHTAVTYTHVDGGAPPGPGQGESALDIENVIGLAPGATIDVYQGPDTVPGAYDTYSAMISSDKAKVISTSWGECEQDISPTAAAAENTLFEEAAAQGQSVFAASGDLGSEDCGTNSLAVDDPAGQPYVTGVGGTTLSAPGAAATEVVWNDIRQGAGAAGGGLSTRWSMPSYQSGAPASLHVVNNSSSGTPCRATLPARCREVPDVSADADPYTGYLVYYEGHWTGMGGTSAAAPVWAALAAIADASSSCHGRPIGFANPALYRIAATSSAGSAFYDVSKGSNDYSGTNSGHFTAGAGYDMASGLGAPNAGVLPGLICAGLAAATGHSVHPQALTIRAPGGIFVTQGVSVSVRLNASGGDAGHVVWSASGLPAGLSISATGVVSGYTTTSSSSIVRARDGAGDVATTTIDWLVVAPRAFP
ncbi:MAG TPA: S53 family peptidase [Acidimicrobiales bacterium]|nr:S53 family peptidase [Acidimicrobiales bacterium]